jgi:glucokinase
MTEVAIAVDIGGTHIKAALIDIAGRVHHAQRLSTGVERGSSAVQETILGVVRTLGTAARERGLTPVGCGIVLPGVIDEQAGVLEWAPNLDLHDVPLRDLVANRVGLPTALGHDVRAGALAEARRGAGQGTDRMFFLAIGTGIAGAFAVNGRIDPGAHGASGEIGHVVIRSGPDAAPCPCGGRGCLERYASAAAVGRAYGDPEVDAAEVVRRAQSGDEHASRVWHTAVGALADGILIGVALFDPAVAVLGGGLARAGTFLLDPLEKELTQRRTFHRLPRLALAQLGDEAGCHGAALLAFDALGTSRPAADAGLARLPGQGHG